MLLTWFWIAAADIVVSKMITLGPKLGVPPGGGGGGGGIAPPVTVNCSHVLAAPRLAIRTPLMLRSAETHWLLDIAWNETVPLACVTMRNFSLVPIAVADAISRPPFPRSVVTKRPLIVARIEVVPLGLLARSNCSHPLAAARFATRKVAPAFSALTKVLFAEALIVAALATAGSSSTASTACARPGCVGTVIVFDMSPPECELAASLRKGSRTGAL